jgi:FeS assembly SUF system protein
MQKDILLLEKQIYDLLKTVYDPEIPVNIYDLGLIYEVDVDDENNVRILMTLTAPNCPLAEGIVTEVQEKIAGIEGTGTVQVDLTFNPPWDKSMMTEYAKLELGFL